jgi:hypothetical protein
MGPAFMALAIGETMGGKSGQQVIRLPEVK